MPGRRIRARAASPQLQPADRLASRHDLQACTLFRERQPSWRQYSLGDIVRKQRARSQQLLWSGPDSILSGCREKLPIYVARGECRERKHRAGVIQK